MTDEPFLASDLPTQASSAAEHRQLDEQIAQLVQDQPYAILCTQGEGQPYGSLVAFAMTEDLSSAVFATPVSTRKYRLLSECDHVALVIDSRSRSSADMMNIEAVTATGRATEVPAGSEHDRCSDLLIRRHPQLEGFVNSPTTAVFRVDMLRYFHVSHFQEVRQWIPTRG
jgi:nitroimidazol reductase NimA-like FMN-containing flavoprotein (pyridoxamine 5'-phosphate oxidase superfamily)